MSGNTIGKIFTVTSFGESHGPAIGCVIDGCPPGVELSEPDIQVDLDRRRPGKTRHTTQRREPDEVEILSGVFEGKTTGTPIGLLIKNIDQRSKDYGDIKNKFRPGHADYTYLQKYGMRDYRGGGRSSARETAMRVAAGAVAKKCLNVIFNTRINGYLSALGEIRPKGFDWMSIEDNPFFWPDRDQVHELEKYMDALRKSGDSIGAEIAVIARGMRPGWGEPVFDRLDADIAHALMSINATKGVEIGSGFKSVTQKGTEHRDQISTDGFLSNNAGGTLGGISSGQDIIARVAFKPTSSIRLEAKTVNEKGQSTEIATKGRHDPCVGIRAVPICEAMLAIVLLDHALRQRGQNGHIQSDTPDIPSDIKN